MLASSTPEPSGLDADFDVEIDHPFHGHQNFHDPPSGWALEQSGRKLKAAPLALSTFMLRRTAALAVLAGRPQHVAAPLSLA